MLLELLELQRTLRSEFSKLSPTLLELASSLCCDLREQPVMFLEPRNVGRPENPVPAQERYICYESSYQPAHSAIVAVRARFVAIKAKPKARVKSAPRARDFSTVINRRRTQQRYSKLPWLSCRLVASPLKHRGSSCKAADTRLFFWGGTKEKS